MTAVCAGSSRTGSVNPDRERAVSKDKMDVTGMGVGVSMDELANEKYFVDFDFDREV